MASNAAIKRAILRRRRTTKKVTESAQSVYARHRAQLSPAQLVFVDDESQQQVAICTRQSGKTTGDLSKLEKKLFGTSNAIGYVAMPTRDIVRDTFWDRWKAICADYGLTDDNHHETLLETRIPNGSVARFIGVKDKKRADRVRGQTADIILIDEAASFADDLLKYFVEECCDPALGIKNGQLVLTSTPGMQPEGYLYEAYTRKDLIFSRHFLELKDNPAWKDPQGYLERVLKKYGYTRDEPKFVREWLGKWVADTRSRVYRIEDTNLIDTAGPCDYTVMALDLGATDESAICVLGWKAGSRKLQVIHEEAEGDLDLTSVADRVRALQAHYQPLVTMVDGAAKQSVLEIQNRHAIPLEATPKAPGYKPKAIAQVNADLRRKLIEIPRSLPLVGQMRALQWKANAIGVLENPGQPNDRCDAFLYAYLRALHYVEHEPEKPIEEGSDEWYRREQEKIREEHARKFQVQQQADPFSDAAGLDPW